MKILRIMSAVLIACLAMPASADPPSLRRQGNATQLVVNGEPVLLIGGELGNSSASSAGYMAPYWPRLRAMHLNAVFAPVSWELIEPVEGQFDWSSVDQLIRDARAHDMRLVILWFGAWKNSMSTYAPGWVKRDLARFRGHRFRTARASTSSPPSARRRRRPTLGPSPPCCVTFERSTTPRTRS